MSAFAVAIGSKADVVTSLKFGRRFQELKKSFGSREPFDRYSLIINGRRRAYL